MKSEYLPTVKGTDLEVVMLHGWASSREIWRPLCAEIHSWANITLIDLPGCTDSSGDMSPARIDDLMREILRISPPRAIFIGWSLGGQLAAYLAESAPGRVSALVTICSNPKFVAAGHWPGMSLPEYAQFFRSADENLRSALRRFDSLQSSGASSPRAISRKLCSARQELDATQLAAGLDLLEALDCRNILKTLPQPQLHLLADNDALVPVSLGAALENILPATHGVRVSLLSACSHAAPLEAAPAIGFELGQFIREAHLVVGGDIEEPAKAEIAESFSKAALQYDSAAQLQKIVGANLLDSIYTKGEPPHRVLDLGCGTAFFLPALERAFPEAEYVGLDLAVGMIEFSRAQFPQVDQWLVGDAENLPLAEESVDLVFSSLAIQWCHNPTRLFAELARVLKPGGRCVFTSLGPATLKELRASWAAVDNRQHVNSFVELIELREAALRVEGLSLELRTEFFVMQYDRVRDLLDELKAIGAHNMNPKRQTGLTGRRALQGMVRAYENWRRDGKLPASYEVVFGQLEKM